MQMWTDIVKKVLHMELCQIHHLSCLAIMSPNEVTRQMVMGIIGDELHEAMFWCQVLCCSDLAVSPESCQPSLPCPGLGPVVSPGMDIAPLPGMPCPGAGPGTIVSPGMDITPLPGMPCPAPPQGKPCPGWHPGVAAPSTGTSPGVTNPVIPGVTPLPPPIYYGAGVAEKKDDKKLI